MNLSLIVLSGVIGIVLVYIIISIVRFKKMPASKDSENVINLDEQNFQQTTKNTVALVDFWADWCMPCKMMAPIINEVADEVKGNVKVCKVNVELQKKLAAKFSVRSIPTTVLLKNGKEVNRFVGVKQKEFLINQINKIKN